MRLPLFFKSTRFWGLAGTALAFYLLFFVVLGKTDVSWMNPSHRIAAVILEGWPQMPFFVVQKESINGGKEQEIYYTVPTRQFSAQEIARMMGTNGMAHPATPKSPISSAR